MAKEQMVSFSRATAFGAELENIAKAISDRRLAGDGPFTAQCEEMIEKRLGAPKAFLTHSCSAALELAARLINLGPGDEAIVPSFTFSSTANAIALTGATPVFADSHPHTLNIDVDKIESLITPHTKAIFVVHYSGLVPDMEAINALANRHGLVVIEDAAQSLGSTYKNEPAGSHSAMSAFSFHETKNTVSGEGGALVINDPQYIDRAAILREKGTNRRAFLHGDVDKYTWMDIGSSYLPSELIAAYLAAQLPYVADINARRLAICDRYLRELGVYEGTGLRWNRQQSEISSANGHIFFGLFDTHENRNTFLKLVGEQNVKAVFHYIPLHSAPAGKEFGKAPDGCPVAESASSRLVRLPLYYEMSDDDVTRVIEVSRKVLEKMSIGTEAA